MVDGKFYGFCLLTNLRETNEFETKSRQVCKAGFFKKKLAWGDTKHFSFVKRCECCLGM